MSIFKLFIVLIALLMNPAEFLARSESGALDEAGKRVWSVELSPNAFKSSDNTYFLDEGDSKMKRPPLPKDSYDQNLDWNVTKNWIPQTIFSHQSQTNPPSLATISLIDQGSQTSLPMPRAFNIGKFTTYPFSTAHNPLWSLLPNVSNRLALPRSGYQDTPSTNSYSVGSGQASQPINRGSWFKDLKLRHYPTLEAISGVYDSGSIQHRSTEGSDISFSESQRLRDDFASPRAYEGRQQAIEGRFRPKTTFEDQVDSMIENLMTSNSHSLPSPFYPAYPAYIGHRIAVSPRKSERSLMTPILVGIGSALFSFLILSNIFLAFPLLAMAFMQFFNGNNMIIPHNQPFNGSGGQLVNPVGRRKKRGAVEYHFEPLVRRAMSSDIFDRLNLINS